MVLIRIGLNLVNNFFVGGLELEFLFWFLVGRLDDILDFCKKIMIRNIRIFDIVLLIVFYFRKVNFIILER